MASEMADKEALPTGADEIVAASASLSQNTETSVNKSQDDDVPEAKQEEDAEMPQAAAESQEDVEMEETQDSVLATATSKEDEKEVQTTESLEAAEEKEEEIEKESEKENEVKTVEDEVTVDSAEAKDTEVIDMEAADGDVEMTDGETQEAKNEDNDADLEVSETPASKEKKLSDNDEAVEKSAEIAAAPECVTKDAPSPSNKEVDAASSTMEVTPTETNAGDDETKESDEPNAAAGDSSNQVLSPKRNEPTMTSTEVSNDVTAQVEPATKKHKVNGIDVQTPKKTDADTAKDAALPPVMISRDDMAKMEEDSGRLKFDVITNDGTNEHLIQLTTLKNIFAKQLPKMPKEYIVRLVFDKNHKSMLILKNGTHVIGGICYRPFEKNHFAEIAFCAINASDQVKGYGTRLMNHLKEYVKTKNITHFLTYADNYAIGYFKKQGFTKSVSMARPNWYGYIKDYDGGTLMECTIHTQINYLRITSMIHMQRKAIQDKVMERSKSQTVYPGLSRFAEGRLMDIYMVPGVKEAGWSQAVIRNNRIGTRDQGSLKSQLSQLLKAVSNHRSAWPFHEPVDTSVVVDYLDHIKEPVDLQLISKRIDSGVYISKTVFKSDLVKMCDNCMLYNTPDTNYYKAAIDLREFIQSRIQIRDNK